MRRGIERNEDIGMFIVVEVEKSMECLRNWEKFVMLSVFSVRRVR